MSGSSVTGLSVLARLGLGLLGMTILLSPTTLALQEARPSPTPAGPVAGPTPDARCRTSERAVLIQKVDPEYPAALRKQRVQGVVRLEGIVQTNGSISDITVLDSPSEALSNLALEAFRRYRYKPALCDGKPVRVYAVNAITFSLAK